MFLNRVTLTANLTKDPELRTLPSGTAVCRLRVATATRAKSAKTGEWCDRASFVTVVCYGSLAEHASKWLTKGRLIGVDGRLESREWEKDGIKRHVVEVVAEGLQFLGAPPVKPEATNSSAPEPEPQEVAA